MAINLARFDDMHAEASKRYNSLFDNRLYLQATRGHTVNYANSLINEALAMCGSPYFSLTLRHWSKSAESFLALFA